MASVLFVCLGNICRSPMAEGLLRHKLSERALSGHVVASAGTAAHHVGEPPDPRTVDVLERHGAMVPMTARQVSGDDFARFDLVLAMDRSNLSELSRRCPAAHRHKLHLTLEPTSGADVPDPYYGGPGGFDRVYDMLDEALGRWLESPYFT